MSKTPGPLTYPNLITDHHTVAKLREIIDRTNAHSTHLLTMSGVQEANQTALAALPASYLTPNDVNTQISQWSVASLTKPPTGAPSFIEVLNSGLVQLGFTVPHPPTGTATVGVTEKLQALSAMHWGKREEAPMLAREDAGFLYYVTDYAHCCYWDGWSWILMDGGGGYFVDTTGIDMGVGYALCDGSKTDYIRNDTPNLELTEFLTPRYRPLRRGHRRFFRR